MSKNKIKNNDKKDSTSKNLLTNKMKRIRNNNKNKNNKRFSLNKKMRMIKLISFQLKEIFQSR